MDLKKSPRPRKTKRVNLRFTEAQYNRVKGLAQMYAEKGNVSLWVIWAAINGPRKFIKREDIEEPRRKPRRR